MSVEIVTGDDLTLPVTLKKDGSTFQIDSGATVQASLVAVDHRTVLAGPVTCNFSATGADWDNSLVVAEFSNAVTSAIVYSGDAKLEVQVDDGGKLTWFVSLSIVRGSIT